jgi:tetratricopeptide (TPR) repeat protein
MNPRPRISRQILLLVAALLPAAGCTGPSPGRFDPRERPLPDGVEAVSLLGEPLRRPNLPADVRHERLERLEDARAAFEVAPDDVDAAVWLGRRTAYLGRYREAIEIYTEALVRHPESAKLRRHRGHRFLTVRRIDEATRDLEEAARLVAGTPDEVEPDGMPNPHGVPTSTLQSNIHYHLGLARYLAADFEGARRAYEEALVVSKNPDMLCATTYWLYLTLRRLGRDEEAARLLAAIHDEMEILENHAYHRLLLFFQGHETSDSILEDARGAGDSLDGATLGYGVGAWYRVQGDRERAVRCFRDVLRSAPWPAFGFLAAEAELARETRGSGRSSPGPG